MLLATANAPVRWALRTVLGMEQALDVVGEASTGLSLISMSHALKPDLILLDWELLNPPQATTLASLRLPNIPCGIIVVSPWAGVRERALAAGADAFLCSCDPPDQFLANLQGFVTARRNCGSAVHSA